MAKRPRGPLDPWDQVQVQQDPGTNRYRMVVEDPDPTFLDRWGNTIEAACIAVVILIMLLAVLQVWGEVTGGFITVTMTVPHHHFPTPLPSVSPP